MKCPKNYGSFDIRTDDCPHCKQGFLYQACSAGKDHPACAGWNNAGGQPNCCGHYTEEANKNPTSANKCPSEEKDKKTPTTIDEYAKRIASRWENHSEKLVVESDGPGRYYLKKVGTTKIDDGETK